MMIFKLIQRREVVWLVGGSIPWCTAQCLYAMRCINGRRTASLHVICVARMWYLCMKRS